MKLELKLSNIEFKNFRLFEQIQLHFDDKLTVLISENGAGKTALLEGIANALTVFVEKIKLPSKKILDLKNIYKNDDIQINKKQLITNIKTLLLIYNPKTNLEKRLEETTWKIVKTTLDTRIKTDDKIGAELLGSSNLPVLIYYSTERNALNAKDNFEENANTEKINTYDDALNGKALNFKWFLEWFIWKEDNLKTDRFLLETVKNAIFEVLNDDTTPTFKAIYTDRTRKRDYRLIVEKDNTAIDVNLLSSGEKSLLMLVGDLARRLALANPDAKDPLKEGQGIVLIDEIDLHLHPRWQRKVMSKLQEIFPKIQWVVTTHSPLVISGYDILPEQVLILTQEENSNKKMVISLADLHAHNSGVEPNRILEEIMRVRLRDKAAETKITELSQLLNPLDFEKPATKQLMNELTHRFGTDDPFIKRAEHTFKILYKKKTAV